MHLRNAEGMVFPGKDLKKRYTFLLETRILYTEVVI